MSYFQKIEQNDGATEVVKDETIITLKNGDRGQKLFTKMFDFVGKKRNETNVFQLCCGQRVTLV